MMEAGFLTGFYLLLQPLFPWSLPVSFASLLYSTHALKLHLLVLVFLGILEDVRAVRPLGVTSFLLVTLYVVKWLLNSYYRSYSLLWSLIIAGGGQLLTFLAYGSHVDLVTLGWQLFFVIGAYGLLQRMGSRDGIYVGS